MEINIPRRLNIRQIQLQKRNVPVDQIIAIEGYNPWAEGAETAGNVLGQAILKRAQLRQQGEELAKLESLSDQQPGAFQGINPELAGSLASTYIKSDLDTRKNAQELARDLFKIKSLESQFGYRPGELGEDYSTARMKVQNDQLEKRLFQREEEKNKTKSARDLDTYTDSASKALQAIGKIRTAAEEMPQFGPGIASQTFGKGLMAIKSYAKDPKTAKYEGVVSQELIPLARNLAEEKGPITDTDVARIEKGLGDKTTPLPVRNELLNELVNKIELGLENKAQTSGQGVEQIMQRNTSLRSLLQQQKAYQSPPAPQALEVERTTKDGKIAIFDANTKQFLRYK